MNDNKTMQPTDDKTETDYQPEVSKIAKRGKNQNLFIFLIIALLAVAFLGYSFLNKRIRNRHRLRKKKNSVRRCVQKYLRHHRQKSLRF